MHIAIVNNPNCQHEYKWLNDIPSLFYNALLPIMVRYYHFLMALVVLAKVISTKAVLTIIVLTKSRFNCGYRNYSHLIFYLIW